MVKQRKQYIKGKRSYTLTVPTTPDFIDVLDACAAMALISRAELLRNAINHGMHHLSMKHPDFQAELLKLRSPFEYERAPCDYTTSRLEWS